MVKLKYKFDRILWLDLEMTGLDPDKDVILEAAAIVTDWKFEELGRFDCVVKSDDRVIGERMAANASFWNEFPELKNKMLEQNALGSSTDEAETKLLAFIDEHFPSKKPVLLAGNSIHMDRRFIVTKWPRLNERLYYRMLDVSAWKVVFENKLKHPFVSPEVHRALDDIRGSIAELKYYLNYLK